jgi:hypothetical protein
MTLPPPGVSSHSMTSRLPALFLTAIVALAGCGSGADENEASAWSGVRGCLAESGIKNFDEVPPTGLYSPPEVMPLKFGDAPGGWLVAHMNGDQELAVFFYGSAAEAERAKDEAPHFPAAMAVSRSGRVLYGFRAPPTPEQVDIAEHCLALPTKT